QVRRICAGNPKLFTNALVPQLSERFRTLDTQTVEVEIVRVIVGFEQLVRILARAPSNSYEVKCDHVLLSGISRCEKVGEAKMFSGRLTRKSEAHFPVLVVDDQIVPF